MYIKAPIVESMACRGFATRAEGSVSAVAIGLITRI